MNKVEKEIRDLLETNLNTTHTAEAGTMTTNITITNHGLSTGDFIENQTYSIVSIIIVVDANNFTVDENLDQDVGDTIVFLRFKKYYVGELDAVPANYSPCLTVYGSNQRMGRRTTMSDEWNMDIHIDIYTNAFSKVSQDDLVDDILEAQAQLKKIMEEPDDNGIPKANTVVGILERNITGQNFLFTHEIEISYGKHQETNRTYFKASLTTKAVRYSKRS